MFRTKEKLTAILVAIVTFVTALLLGFATLLGIPQKVSTAKAATATQYVKVTSAPTDWSGEYLIVYESGTNAYIFNAVDAAKGYASATISNGTIAGSATVDAEVVTIATMSGGYSIKSKNGYIYGTSGSNKLNFNTSSAKLNTIAWDNGNVKITSSTSVLRFNKATSDMRFRYYKSSSYTNQQPICLYKKETVTTCEHANKILQPVTDTETHIYFCNDCQKTVGEAIDCTWGEGVVTTPATNTTDGVMTYTCTECSNTKEEVIPKLDAVIYTITYSTPNGINAPDADEIAEGFTATLPTANAPDGYVFVGWTTNQAATNEEGVCLAGSEYTVTENVTLYALYKTDVKAGGWYLVESAASLEIGEKYTIVAGDYNFVIGTSAGNYFNKVEITKDTANKTFSCTEEFTELTLETGASSNTYSFKYNNSYLAAQPGKNYLVTSTTKIGVSSWTIAITNGEATITETDTSAGTPYSIKYNSSSPRFSCYTSAQTPVSLYKYVAGEEPIYSTNPCNHEGAPWEETTPATCTTAGEKTYTCTCGKTWTEEIPATEHVNTEIRHIDDTNTHAKYCIACGVIQGEAVDCSGSATSNNDEATHTVTCGDCGHQFNQDCQWEGDTTLTCKDCGATKETALCTITFSVFGNTDIIEAQQQNINKTIDLPNTLDNLPMGVSFVGWTTNENATTADGVLTGSYTVKKDETLYALISYVRYENATAYEKVTEAPADWSGKYLIVYEDNNTAYIFNGQDAVNGYLSATIQDGVIISTDKIEAVVATIESMTGGYSIKTANGYTYGTSGSNKLNFNTTTAQLNTIQFTADNGILITSNTSVLRFNAASNQMRFRYYKSEGYTDQKAIQLYAATTIQVPVTAYTTTLTAKFDSASLTIGTDLTMNYYATVDAVYTNLKAQFTIAGDIIEVEGEYDSTENRYVFSFALPPQCMADNISAVLLSGETEIAWVNNYSVRNYAINTLNKTNDEKLETLLYELLRYGAAAQQYTGYNTGDLATNGVTTLPDAADVNATDAYKLTNHIENGTADDYPVYITAVGVRFENVNKIYVKFNATAENVSVRISRDGVEVGTFALNDTILYTNEIYATAFDDVFTFEVIIGETKTQTLTYSVNSYVANRVAAGSNDAMTDLAKALYLYGEAAKAYAPLAN